MDVKHDTDLEEEQKVLKRFLDDTGKLKQLPTKKSTRLIVLRFLSQHFESGKDYTEKEVNSKLNALHSFGDFFLLRRELIDSGLLSRERNGSRYWRET
jgi:hypothetical protein